MNLYVVVEGAGEKKVYAKWLPLLNPALREIDFIDEVTQNNFLIRDGGGMPQYFGVIEAGARDVGANPAFDRLVVCVDSEDKTCTEKCQEVLAFVQGLGLPVDCRVVVQHFCLEAWALGNRAIVRPSPRSEPLASFKRHFDVRELDPELLTPIPGLDISKARFAERYLRAALNDRYRNLSYIKSKPEALMHATYFRQLQNRLQETGHIPSFSSLAQAIA